MLKWSQNARIASRPFSLTSYVVLPPPRAVAMCFTPSSSYLLCPLLRPRQQCTSRHVSRTWRLAVGGRWVGVQRDRPPHDDLSAERLRLVRVAAGVVERDPDHARFLRTGADDALRVAAACRGGRTGTEGHLGACVHPMSHTGGTGGERCLLRRCGATRRRPQLAPYLNRRAHSALARTVLASDHVDVGALGRHRAHVSTPRVCLQPATGPHTIHAPPYRSTPSHARTGTARNSPTPPAGARGT